MIIPKNPATSTPAKAPVAPQVQQPAPRPAPVPVVATPMPAPIPAPRPAPAPVQQQMIPAAPRPAPVQQHAAQPQNQGAMVKHSPVAVPAFIEAAPEGEIAAGFENVGNEAYKLAMLGVAQPMSPQVTETRTLQAGDAYLTTARDAKLFGPGDQLEVIPFFYYKSYDLWNHRDLGGGLINSSLEPNGEIARLAQRQLKEKRLNPQPTAKDQPEQAVESLVFLGLFVDTDESGNSTYVPIAIPFAKSKYKKGVAWLQLAQKASHQGKYPMYCAKYLVTTVFENGKRGSFYNFDIDFSPNPVTKEDADAAKNANVEFGEIYRQRKLKIEQDADLTPDTEIVGAAPASDQPKAY